MYTSEQSKLFDRCAVASSLDPGPDNRNGTTAIGNSDHQQLVMKADFAPIDNQAHSSMLSLALEQHLGNRVVPLAHADVTLQ